MGSYAELTLTADLPRSELLALSQTLFAELDRLDAKFSFHRCDSALSALNRRAAAALPADLDDETAALLRQALRFSAATAGRFDMCVASDLVALGHLPAHVGTVAPGASWRDLAVQGNRLHVGRAALLDLGGIAKGYAVDCVRDSLQKMGVTDALIDLSGNIAQLGSPPGREHWRLGLRDPANRDATLGTLTLTRAAVATSGDYEQFVAADGRRYGHILDPRSGWPADSLASVTVVMDSAMDADAWATALCVMGPAAAKKLAAARDDMDVILVERREDGPDLIWVEGSLAGSYSMSSGDGAGYRLHRF